MNFLFRFILQIAFNALAVWLTITYVPGASLSGGANWVLWAEIGAVLGVLNFLVRPVLKLIFGPLIFLTFGLFILIINGILVWLLTKVFSQLIIPVGMPLFWATIIISFVNSTFHLLTKK